MRFKTVVLTKWGKAQIHYSFHMSRNQSNQPIFLSFSSTQIECLRPRRLEDVQWNGYSRNETMLPSRKGEKKRRVKGNISPGNVIQVGHKREDKSIPSQGTKKKKESRKRNGRE